MTHQPVLSCSCDRARAVGRLCLYAAPREGPAAALARGPRRTRRQLMVHEACPTNAIGRLLLAPPRTSSHLLAPPLTSSHLSSPPLSPPSTSSHHLLSSPPVITSSHLISSPHLPSPAGTARWTTPSPPCTPSSSSYGSAPTLRRGTSARHARRELLTTPGPTPSFLTDSRRRSFSGRPSSLSSGALRTMRRPNGSAPSSEQTSSPASTRPRAILCHSPRYPIAAHT
jgi:hypothetical protein